MSLPKFTEQQQFVIANLIAMASHRKIAKAFQTLYPEFAPEVGDKDYEKAFIKRAKDYVSNKDRKWHQIIRDGRNERKDSLDHLLLTHKQYRVQVREDVLEQVEQICR